MKLPVKTTSTEYASADTMILDEAGVELLIDGDFELGASFENLDSFQLAYAVLPTDFELNEESSALLRQFTENGGEEAEDSLETIIWVASQALAKRRGYLRK